MGIIGSVVGGLAGIGGAIGAGIAGRKAYEKNMGILNDMRQDSQNWYDREYNSDFTQRADAQAALTTHGESLTRDIGGRRVPPPLRERPMSPWPCRNKRPTRSWGT